MLVASLARPRWPSTPRTRVLLCDWVVLCLVKSRVVGLIEREGRLSHERVRRDIAHHDVIERMIPNLMSATLVHEFGHARAYRMAQEMQLSDKSIDNQATLAVVVLTPLETMSWSTFGAAAPQELTSTVHVQIARLELHAVCRGQSHRTHVSLTGRGVAVAEKQSATVCCSLGLHVGKADDATTGHPELSIRKLWLQDDV